MMGLFGDNFIFNVYDSKVTCYWDTLFEVANYFDMLMIVE